MQIWGAGPMGLRHIAGDAVDHIDIDAEIALPINRLAGDFEQDPAVFRRGGLSTLMIRTGAV